jgi:hypothetical protein
MDDTTSETRLRFPDGNESRYVDWGQAAGEDFDGFTWWEPFDFEHNDQTFTLMASNGSVTGAVVGGRHVERWEIDDKTDDDMPDSEFWRALLDAVDKAEGEGTATWGAEGPMMNYFWPVVNDADGRSGADWAVWLTDVPLCVVQLGDELGLGLTGGGMDLSWEIAQAYIALGYYPPTTLELPAMAGLDPNAEPYRTTVRALVAHLRRSAEFYKDRANRLAARLSDSTD